ncbi:MAG: hypothetical protein QW323_04795, partial [Candidatus Bathyarchaeia archaeon]
SNPAPGTSTSSSGALHIASPFKSSDIEFSVTADIHEVGKRLETVRARLSGLDHKNLHKNILKTFNSAASRLSIICLSSFHANISCGEKL